ncbi:MAG TPA: twin-arginine translocation signal domain-containing protein [Candidatus Binatia bacterium]|jgi:hypothetical protein|nr:twin-arginine translocation signal domain-containing protein [Candidatus Binatia bacterium]
MLNVNQPLPGLPRRTFLKGVAASAGALALGGPSLLAQPLPGKTLPAKPPYRGPKVIIVRFGGGARRRETIDPQTTCAPFLCRDFAKRGTLFTKMEIDSFTPTVGVDTSHGQGTLYIITGKYEKYKDITEKFLSERFASKAPTIFEYLRKSYNVPESQTLIINSEDRTNEEFYTFSNHHLYGINYRSNTLSLYRYKTYLLRRAIQAGKWSGKELEKQQKQLAKLEAVDYRNAEPNGQGPELVRFWDRWREYYGETGLVNPRGDRLLTELAIRSLKDLRPQLLMVNYQDCDYVHWGNLTHYTRALTIIDDGLKQLVAAVEADPEYRDNTVFVVVPDCGRDNNPLADVPCQHHFGSRSSHEIFALLVGAGVRRGLVVDNATDQISIAGTIGHLMGFKAEHAETRVLEEAIA